MDKKIIFSGIQPTGELHLGNYFGAVQNWVTLQEKYQCIYQIVDLHALTVPFKTAKLSEQVIKLAAELLACGLDPRKSLFTVQSLVPEHTELAWILGCLAPLGMLERMPTYKEKAEQYNKQLNFGLLAYPVLMAADILLYKAQAVPVGEDQDPHLEFARYLAEKFNHQFKKFFPVPEILKTPSPRLLGLDGKHKMSKSRKNHLAVTEAPESIRRKVKAATTDSGREIKFSPAKQAVSNLLAIYCLCSGASPAEAEKHFAHQGYAGFKAELAEAVINRFKPIREKYLELIKDPDGIKKILTQGAEQCRAKAQKNLRQIKDLVGISY